MFEHYSWYFRNALVRANYRNVQKGINAEPIFLVRFFRNLLLGETNELKNRYMLVNPPEEWNTPTSSPISTPTSSHVSILNSVSKICTHNNNVVELVRVVGNEEMSIKQMMEKKGLKDRRNFLDNHLNPALKERFVRMKYPDKPNHPRQRYLLTVKGLALYNEIKK